MALGRAVRAWARANPHEYALIFGSPVPGYAAPEDTVGPATRVPLLLCSVLVDADAFGRLAGTGPTPTAGAIVDLDQLRSTFFAGVPVRSVAAGVMAWTQLFGTVNAELFGHLHNVIDDGDAWFETVLAALVESVGVLPPRDRKMQRESRREDTSEGYQVTPNMVAFCNRVGLRSLHERTNGQEPRRGGSSPSCGEGCVGRRIHSGVRPPASRSGRPAPLCRRDG